MGFFAEAGPVQVFVSNHLIPQDFAFASTDEPCFVSGDESVRIIKGAEVRLRIVGTRVDATEIVCFFPPSSPYFSNLKLQAVSLQPEVMTEVIAGAFKY